jgi:hypothetical protein
LIVFSVIVPDYLIPKVISDYLSIAFREKLMITVAKHMIILVIIKSCSAALQFRTPFERFVLLFKSRTSSALQFYSESQGRANG